MSFSVWTKYVGYPLKDTAVESLRVRLEILDTTRVQLLKAIDSLQEICEHEWHEVDTTIHNRDSEDICKKCGVCK